MYHIICFLDHDRGRDPEMMIPLIYLAEKYLNCRIETLFIWEAHKIYLQKPDLVLLPNTIGSPLYFKISRYAHQQKVPVFALISEGNFRTDGTFKYWGYNTDDFYYEEYICLWSKRTFDFLKDAVPHQGKQMAVTGGVGFDRYKIYDFQSKEEVLSKYKLDHYQKVVGYAGWAFGKLNYPEGIAEVRYLHKRDPNRIQWMRDQRAQVESVLREAIEKNPDILFILKRHPNEVRPHINTEGINEMNQLTHYPNVLYIRNEENLHDLINISDVWLGFESTTVLESWLMKTDKPTIFINPDPDFKRDKLYQGTLIASNYTELQAYLNEYYEKGIVEAFLTAEKEENRKKLIAATIGYGDGFNHVRAGILLKRTLDKIPANPARSFFISLDFFIKYWLLHVGKYFYIRSLFGKLPKFKKTVWIFDRYKLSNIPHLKEMYYPYLDRFHQKHEVSDIFEGKKEINIVED